MTTSVKVIAHCSKDKQVRVIKRNGAEVVSENVIQGGEYREDYVYDGLSIEVKEELREVGQRPAD